MWKQTELLQPFLKPRHSYFLLLSHKLCTLLCVKFIIIRSSTHTHTHTQQTLLTHIITNIDTHTYTHTHTPHTRWKENCLVLHSPLPSPFHSGKKENFLAGIEGEKDAWERGKGRENCCSGFKCTRVYVSVCVCVRLMYASVYACLQLQSGDINMGCIKTVYVWHLNKKL